MLPRGVKCQEWEPANCQLTALCTTCTMCIHPAGEIAGARSDELYCETPSCAHVREEGSTKCAFCNGHGEWTHGPARNSLPGHTAGRGAHSRAGGAVVRDIIEIQPNGDPYGSGFTGIESTDNGQSWFYRGDIGARPRWWWRNYCRRENIILRYA